MSQNIIINSKHGNVTVWSSSAVQSNWVYYSSTQLCIENDTEYVKITYKMSRELFRLKIPVYGNDYQLIKRGRFYTGSFWVKKQHATTIGRIFYIGD